MPVCKICGKTFNARNVTQVYCSYDCRAIGNRENAKQYQAKMQARKEPIIKQCACCGADFVYTIHNKRYCSPECAHKVQYEERKAVKSERKRKKKPKTVRDIAKEARAHGMSYGKYVAMLEMQKGLE